ncbi:MAG: type II secretion system F family protein [Planctomycetes bacterium]|nr:type II secretion system F family protein [Planctomycetota bacterium]MBI3844255.1 type II secretion system F family protein [Planctomycetota bacterium]
MARYSVEWVERSGEASVGVVEAPSPEAALARVRSRGAFPVSWKEEMARRTEAPVRAGIVPMANRDRILFTRKLAVFLKAGFPLLQALDVLEEQVQRGRLRSRIAGIRQGIIGGESFAEALSRFPADFSRFYVAVVRAGEESGEIASVLEKLADDLATRADRRKRMITALFYPILILIVTVGIVTVVSLKFIPLVENFLRTLHVSLPPLTAGVLEANAWLRGKLPLIGAALVGGIVAVRLLLRFRDPRRVAHRFLLSVPLIGRIVRIGNFSWVFQSLSVLGYSGVPVLEAFRITAEISKNEVIRGDVDRCRMEIARGRSISDALGGGPLFERFAVSMVEVGEKTGEIDQMMERIAEYYEEELETLYARLQSLAPTILTLILAALVGTVIVALYLPILTIVDALAGNQNPF